MFKDDVYIVRNYEGNLVMFLGQPILMPKYKIIKQTTNDFYGEPRVELIETDEYLYDEWVNPIYPDDIFDSRRYGFLVEDKYFADSFKNLTHTDSPVLISKPDGEQEIQF